VAFDAVFARDVVLPLAQAAHDVMGGGTATLPAGYTQTSLIKADAVAMAVTVAPQPAVTAMTKDNDIFGLMGHNLTSRTAFVSFRGTSSLDDWLADVDVIPADYLPISGFGQVHTGFQDVYELIRGSIATNLAAATAGCDQRAQPRGGAGRARRARHLSEDATEHDRAAADHVCRAPRGPERFRRQFQRGDRKLFSGSEFPRHRAPCAADAVRARRCSDHRRQWWTGPGPLAAQLGRL
jgi:hypothetical protein